jgi:FG-GAP-like repeat
MAQVRVSPKSILPTQGHSERLRSFATSGQRGYKGANTAARPMATPPVLTPPPATSNVGFQVTRQLSSGVTPNLSESTAPLVTVVGDFNGDGKPDVASIVQDLDSNFWLSILLSNGDGTFQTPVLTAVPFNATDLLASADLNGDGKADVVCSC